MTDAKNGRSARMAGDMPYCSLSMFQHTSCHVAKPLLPCLSHLRAAVCFLNWLALLGYDWRRHLGLPSHKPLIAFTGCLHNLLILSMLLHRTENVMALRTEARKATVNIDTISCLGSSQLLEWPELCPLNWTPWSYPAIGLTEIEAVGGITYTCNFLHLSSNLTSLHLID